MPVKTQQETDAEIISSAKIADVILPEIASEIRIRHTRSAHPVQCYCLLHRVTRFDKNFSSSRENEVKDSLEWSREPE